MAKISSQGTVFMEGHGFARYVVVAVDSKKQTADVRNVSGVNVLHRGIPWSALHRLDKYQNALRIMRESALLIPYRFLHPASKHKSLFF
jgi:hypothetical protein